MNVSKPVLISVVFLGVITGLTISQVFNVIATDGGGNPFTTVWEAIYGLQSRVEALEVRVPRKGYISVSPVAFMPVYGTAMYLKSLEAIYGGVLFAPVQLPNGAIITNVTAKFFDGSYHAIWLSLWRTALADSNSQEMVFLYTGHEEWSSGSIVLYEDTIEHAEVDNQNYMYALEAEFSTYTPDLYLMWVLIEYEYQAR